MHRAPALIRRQSLSQSLSTTVAKESSAILSASAVDPSALNAFDLPYQVGDASSPLIGYSHARRLSTAAKSPSPPPAMPAALLFDGPAMTKQGRASSRPHATSLGPAVMFDGPSRSRSATTTRVIIEPSHPRVAPSQTLLPDWCKAKLAKLEGLLDSALPAPGLVPAA